MDKELLEILTAIQNDMKSMQNDMKSMQNGMKSMQNDMKSMQNGMKSMQGDITKLDSKVDRNTVILENLNTKVEIIAEVQTSHKEQGERYFENYSKNKNDTTTLITSSLKNVSDDVVEVKLDVKELKGKFDKVEKVTIQNTYDVAYLKSVK